MMHKNSVTSFRIGTDYKRTLGLLYMTSMIHLWQTQPDLDLGAVRGCLGLLCELCSTNFTVEQLHKKLEFVEYLFSCSHNFIFFSWTECVKLKSRLVKKRGAELKTWRVFNFVIRACPCLFCVLPPYWKTWRLGHDCGNQGVINWRLVFHVCS